MTPTSSQSASFILSDVRQVFPQVREMCTLVPSRHLTIRIETYREIVYACQAYQHFVNVSWYRCIKIRYIYRPKRYIS